MGLKIWLELVPVFSLLKQQSSEPGMKSMCPTGPSHEQKVEEGWERLWELQRVARHPMFIFCET